MNRHFRISLVTETFLPQVNGVSRTLERLVRHCTDQGDRIQLLIPRYDENSVKLPTNVEKRDWWALPLPFYKEVVLPFVTIGTIEQALKNFRPDLVHIATEGPLGWAALKAAKRLRQPILSSYHTNFPQYLENYRASFLAPICWKYLRWFHNNTLGTFCPSDSTRHLIESKGLKNVGIWSRGVDSHKFSPGKRDYELRKAYNINPDDIVMTYAGRIANEKNLQMLVDAWKMLNKYQNAHLLFIGDGPLRTKLEAMQVPRTIFAGYRYGEELSSMYASSDIFVFPSLSETFGNVVLEAMASGLPVVAYDVQGPKDIINHQTNGLLVDTIDAESLSRAMQKLLVNSELRWEMGRKARAYAESQTWAKIMDGMRDRYAACASSEKEAQVKLAQINRSAASLPNR
ncbi:MAG: glycosyltransferase family 1 protein [Deltaproteobacteria bacterium]|jgi:glycosyltransferase involved in cell wall biosynthesis|nr:glycosyltransferase family 1 protein [Deltaproteobacteria bacterium]